MRKLDYEISTSLCLLVSIFLLLSFRLIGIAHAIEENPLDAKRVTLKLSSADFIDVIGVLNDQLRIPVSVEDRIPDPRHTLKSDYAPTFKVDIQDITGRAALDKVNSMVGTHFWVQSNDPSTINMIPIIYRNDPNWLPNRTCHQFSVENALRSDVVNQISEFIGLKGEDRIRAVGGGSIFVPSGEKLEDNWLYKFLNNRITLTIKAGTVREAFNQIAAAIGNGWWIYSEQDLGNGKYRRLISFYPVTPNVLPQPDPLLVPSQ